MNVNIEHIKFINQAPSKTLLNNVCFSLKDGNIYTILGKNGSGKTTLVNSLSKLLDTNNFEVKGSVNFNGIDIYKTNIESLIKIRKENIKYVFQDSINSFDPIRKFGYYFNRLCLDEKKLDELLNYFLLPAGEKLSNMHPYEVSGGMAQRISVCLAILTNPKILILDEPTSAIDITISNLLCSKLKEYANDTQSIILIITQDIDFAENVSDYTAYLNEGTLSQFVHKSFSKPKNI